MPYVVDKLSLVRFICSICDYEWYVVHRPTEDMDVEEQLARKPKMCAKCKNRAWDRRN